MTLQRRRALLASLTAVLLFPASALAVAGTAHAATTPVTCPTVQPAVQVGDAGTPLEGAVVDTKGRLLVTDLLNGKVLRFDKPGATPTTIATLPDGEGGGGALALTPDGTVLVGGGANIQVFNGDVIKPGTIWKLTDSSTTGTLTKLYSGFSAANGMDVAKDGTIYATNDFGNYVGRVLPNGTVQSQWTRFPSANGAVLSHDDKYLYVSRTFWNPGVSRIPVNNPTKPESLLDLQFPKTFDAPDGLTLDSQDRPVVPTDVGGEILRIEKPGVTCLLAKNLGASSVIVYGRGSVGFSAGHLYRAGFDGKIYEVPSGFDPGQL